MKAKWVFKLIIGFTVVIIVVGWVVMLLWNFLMPVVFNLPVINFYQALGLLILSKILFGHAGRGWGGGMWKNKWKEKWGSMTPEEKEKFREQWKMRCEKWKSEDKK